jgi:hypothetical protein
MSVPAQENLRGFLRLFEQDANTFKALPGKASWMEAAFLLEEAFGNQVDWTMLSRKFRRRVMFDEAASRVYTAQKVSGKFGGLAAHGANARVARLLRQFERNKADFVAIDLAKMAIYERIGHIKLMIWHLGAAGRLRGAVTWIGVQGVPPQLIADRAWSEDANWRLFETRGVMLAGNVPFPPVGALFLPRETVKIWLGFVASRKLTSPAELEDTLLEVPPPDEPLKSLLSRFGVTGPISIDEANFITDQVRPGAEGLERYKFAKKLQTTARRLKSDGNKVYRQ